jgi:hypothetical protein
METEFANDYISIGSDLLYKVSLEAKIQGMSANEFIERLVEDYFASTDLLERH